MHKIFSTALMVAGGLLAASGVLAAGPSISSVSPATATSNVPVTFTATVSSAVSIQTCHLYVDLADVGEMVVSNGTASRAFTFTSGGSRVAFVYCRDTAGGLGAGQNTAIWVEGTIVNQPAYGSSNQYQEQPAPQTPTSPPVTAVVAARTLVKLTCPTNAGANDVCKAVYYVGADGKRHAFPNSQTYFTWYQSFDNLTELSSANLASLPLGKNVTYRPGTRMVKFTTDNKVYAVAANGTLRWIKTEVLAIALFGSDWSKKIDDIPDTFYMNYAFGTDINAATEYNPTAEQTTSPTFD